MSVHTSTTEVRSNASAIVALGLGAFAALLTTILSFAAVALGAGALVAGVLSWRRHGLSAQAAAGMAMAAVTVYLVVLEIFFTG